MSPHQMRFEGTPFKGKIIPFGAEIYFLPSMPKRAMQDKMAPKMVKGIFLGYQFHKGGKWRGEYHVTSLRELVLGVIVPHRTAYVTVTREIEWHDKELPRFPAGYAIKRAKAINSLTANRDEVVSRVEAEVDMYMELCPDTDESEYSSASEAPDCSRTRRKTRETKMPHRC